VSEFHRPDPAPLPDDDATQEGTEEHSEQPEDHRGEARPDSRERRGPVFGTIFWGALLLVVALLVGIQSVPSVTIDPTVLLIGAVVALGCLLVVAGIAAAVRRPRS
jgi:hypothetical protein